MMNRHSVFVVATAFSFGGGCAISDPDSSDEEAIEDSAQEQGLNSAWSTTTSTVPRSGVWGVSSSNVYSTGDNGSGATKVMRFDGAVWTTLRSYTGQTSTNSIWASASNDVYEGDNNLNVSRYNGSTWALESLPGPLGRRIEGLWGTGTTRFAVGESGYIARKTGSVWSAMTSGTSQRLFAIWGTSSSNVFAVGAAGTILRFNGTSWTSMSSGTTSTLKGVWGSSSTDVYAVGYPTSGSTGVILHYNGTSWSAVSPSISDTSYEGVWGSGPKDVYVVSSTTGSKILHFNGCSWSADLTTPFSSYKLKDIWGSGPSNVFAVGVWGVQGITLRRTTAIPSC